MRCLHCKREGNLIQGTCQWCGSPSPIGRSSSSPGYPTWAGLFPPITPEGHSSSSGPTSAELLERSHASGPLPAREQFMRGDLLNGGRYRLLNQISLPENQQGQGSAWNALDIPVAHRLVVIREIRVPPYLATNAPEIVSEVHARCKRLGEQPGFPEVVELFYEKGSCFLVLLHPEGMTLSSLLEQNGGTLPEDRVALYGYQLCRLLAIFMDQQPPLVHGSITPDTILLSYDLQSITLLHVPLFPPEVRPHGEAHTSAGYAPPEQVRGIEITPSSDLYSVAVCMHHAVTGYDPRMRLALFHPLARRLNPAVTLQMEQILHRQLALSPQQRYSHPEEMQQALVTVLESYPDAISTEHAIQAVDPLRLSMAQLRERSRSASLLDLGAFAAMCTLLLMGLLLLLLRT